MKRVLVTGANKGIGKAIVQEILAHADDTAVVLGSRSIERGKAARDDLLTQNQSWQGRVDVVALDVADDASVRAAAESVAAANDQPLYGIVNNAGIGFGADDLARTLQVNARGPKRVCDAFLPNLQPVGGRIVMISSASGPNFVAACNPQRQAFLTNPDVTWAEVDGFMNECVEIAATGGDFQAAGLGDGNAYGMSKACLNAYTIALARQNPDLVINACTPGFIETDLTRPFAEQRGTTPESLGMKPPVEGTRSALYLLFGDVEGRGWYFGSDAVRSPLDRYRSPGDPPYTGD